MTPSILLDHQNAAESKFKPSGEPDILQLDPHNLPDKYGWPRKNARGYKILEEPFGTLRPFRVVHIGAGASGICFSKFAENLTRNVSWVCYEKNSDIGGTWLENRYPGCACDIPSVNYQFTWARNPNWSHFYSYSPEIWQYFRDVVDKNDLMKHFKLKHEVVGAYWNAEEGLWHIKVVNDQGEEFEDTCNVLLNGGGILKFVPLHFHSLVSGELLTASDGSNWKWPVIEGLHSFKGRLLHSARYDESLKLDGKRVAVIGAGSSGVQIISNIAGIVKELYTWVRSPTWITAGFAQRFAGPNGANFAYTDEQKEEFNKDPKKFLKYSKLIESELNQRFKFILKGTPEAEAAKAFSANEMSTKLAGDAQLIDAIVPKDFGVGCRRPTPGNGFLEALIQDNVKCFTKDMKRITEKGFVDSNGVEHEVDVIICATGFDTSWVPRFPVVANGRNLQDMWKKELSSYLSIGAPYMANYWMAGGPYGPLGHGSFLPIIEVLMKNFIECINKMQKERIKSLTPKASMAAALKEHADLYLQRTAWTGGCSSWFKQGRVDGPVPIFPGSRITYMEMMEKPRFEDYEFEYMNPLNPLEFMGNGFSTRESDGRDLSYYLGLIDGRDEQIDLEADL